MDSITIAGEFSRLLWSGAHHYENPSQCCSAKQVKSASAFPVERLKRLEGTVPVSYVKQ